MADAQPEFSHNTGRALLALDLQRKVTEATTIASAPGILTRCSSAPKPFLAFYPVLPRAAPTKLSTTNFHFIVTHYTVELSAPIMDKLHAICNQLPAVPQCGLVLLATVGGLFVASKLFSYLRLVLGSFILPGTNLRKYGKAGTWAVVTGASDGLGKELASLVVNAIEHGVSNSLK
ncbi:hypothetical protein NQ176_g4161 [Zarea fungicola]|uniref:Uncharacterized protein n=1 Tax=Zarea fungicola TaxID=93591 RepID=A0ACC1NFX8_9HYPO|nr:hypothetical protein NQ176_g4161 [Lecanicillium fungicola]